jgi:hypothetical protein
MCQLLRNISTVFNTQNETKRICCELPFKETSSALSTQYLWKKKPPTGQKVTIPLLRHHKLMLRWVHGITPQGYIAFSSPMQEQTFLCQFSWL